MEARGWNLFDSLWRPACTRHLYQDVFLPSVGRSWIYFCLPTFCLNLLFLCSFLSDRFFSTVFPLLPSGSSLRCFSLSLDQYSLCFASLVFGPWFWGISGVLWYFVNVFKPGYFLLFYVNNFLSLLLIWRFIWIPRIFRSLRLIR